MNAVLASVCSKTKYCQSTDQNDNVLMMQTLALNQTCPLGDERPHIYIVGYPFLKWTHIHECMNVVYMRASV